MIRPHHLAALALAASACTALPASAAESFDSCDGRFIDSLPATISTPGVWCLRHDVSTAIGAGAAIQVTANNVTLDCNGFRLGGLAAGSATTAIGIFAVNRYNTTVRNCSIRGFAFGTWFWSGAGHAIVDSRFDQNTHVAILAKGAGLSILRNRIVDTGGSTAENLYGSASATGINADGDGEVAHNTVLDTVATCGLLLANEIGLPGRS